MRMQVDRAAAGGLVINDAYNANPTSMAAALDALAAVDADRRIAVLGMMAELDDPAPAHLADRRPGRGARASSSSPSAPTATASSRWTPPTSPP